MRNSENRQGVRTRYSSTGKRFSGLTRGLLLAAILVAGLMVYRVLQRGSAADEATALAKQETGLHPAAEPTEATPDSARQAVKAPVQAEDRTSDGVRSDAAPPSADIAIAKSFTVDDSRAYVYTVRMGEFWSLIANRFNLTSDLLRGANVELWQLRGDEIQPGDQLTIPGLSAAAMIPPTLYTVESGDSWYDIADMFSVTFLDLLLDNFELWAERGINIEAGDELKVTFLPPGLTRAAISSGSENAPLAMAPSSAAKKDGGGPLVTERKDTAKAVSGSAGTYVVQPGDTWESVAAETGIDMIALKEVNQELSEQALQPGDVLRISWILHVSVTFHRAERRGVRSASDLGSLSEEELAALSARGLFVYKEQYCGICHQLDSASTKGIFGPSHNGMASLAAARLQDPAYNGAATDVHTYLYESIIEPDAYFVEGFALSPHRMPTYRHIPEDDLEALIVFLAEQ